MNEQRTICEPTQRNPESRPYCLGSGKTCGEEGGVKAEEYRMDAYQMIPVVKYVAGFLFNDERSAVALMHKTHGPACMVGKWNAIGGKRKQIQPALDESSYAAMWREFYEEAGVHVNGWTPFLKLRGKGWLVDFYHAFSSDALAQVRTCEGETVEVFNIDTLPETVPNLKWIIPMALGHEDDHVWVYEVTEKETFAPRMRTPAEA